MRSVLLVKEASDTIDSAVKPGKHYLTPSRFRISHRSRDQTGAEAGPLANSCVGLISTLTSHVDGLTKLLTGPSSEDRATAVSFRSSLVQSLTALAEILDLLSRISPGTIAADYRRQCIGSLMQAVGVVRGLDHGDFLNVGAFLGVRRLNRADNYSPLTLG